MAFEKNLRKAKSIGVDVAALEANAAMKSIMRRGGSGTWKAYLAKLAKEPASRIRWPAARWCTAGPREASDMELRPVCADGSIKWVGKMLLVGEAREGEFVGLRQVDDEAWSLSLVSMRLATLRGRWRVLVLTSPEEVSPIYPDRGPETP